MLIYFILSLVPSASILASQSNWSRLQSLVLHFQYLHQNITETCIQLAQFRPPTLKEVTVELASVSILDITGDLSRRNQPKQDVYEKLEDILCQFSQREIVWILKGSLRYRRDSFWTRELRNNFPLLSRHGKVTLKSEIGNFGHFVARDTLINHPFSWSGRT